MKQRVARLFVSLALGVLLAGTSFAQFNAAIEGTVLDPSGAAVPGAAVKITNVNTGVVSTTNTAGAGFYRVAALPPGTYRVQVSKPGFTTVTQENVVLEATRVQTVPITLTVGAVSTEVTVNEAPPVVETAQGSISELTTVKEVIDLPLSGRNILNVVGQTPGVTGTGLVADRAGANDIFNAVSSPYVNANGLRGDANAFYVDDSSVNDNPDQGGAKLAPNPDSVQEVRVSINNYSAEYGRNSSVLTQVITKSGTNSFHGSLFEYHTNNKLNARNVFQNSPNPVTGRILPVSRRNEFGGSFGGAIRKDKTFFFGSYDQLRSSTGVASLRTVETPDFASWMQSNRPNAIGTQLLSSFPAQVALTGRVQTVADVMNSTGLGACSGTNSLGMPCNLPILQTGVLSATAPRTGIQWNTRIDQFFTQSDRLYFNFYRMTNTGNSINPRPAFTNFPPALTDYAQINYTHTFSPTFLNEAAFGFTRNYGASVTPQPHVPDISISGMSGFGGGWGPAGFVQNDFHWRDLASINRGSHALKTGLDIYRDQDNAPFSTATLRPSFSFANVFDFAQDKPYAESNINFDPRNGGPPFQDYGFRSTTFGFFVQDDWRVRPNLTLNLGVRWDFSGNPTMNVGRLTNLVLGSGDTFQQRIAGAKVIPVQHMFENNHIGNFAPRIGFAWDPTGKGKISIRSGFGIFYNRWPNKVWSDTTRGNPPYLAAVTASTQNPSGPQPFYALGTTNTPPFNIPLPAVQPGLNPANGASCCFSSVGGADQSLNYEYAENWFFGVQFSPFHGWVLEADYMGSGGKDLYNVIDRNRFAGDLIVNNGTLQRLNPYFASINYGDNSGTSMYHGGTFAVRKFLSSNVTFQASYTIGKVVDLMSQVPPGSASVYAPVIDAYNFRLQRGVADFDIPQKFAFNFVVDLPRLSNMHPAVRAVLGGWEASSLAVLQKGYPATVFTSAPFQPVWNDSSCATAVHAGCHVIGNSGGDYNADGTNFDVPMAPSFPASRTYGRGQFINGVFSASDFPAPPLGQEGNLGRNVFRGPGFANVDFSLLKNFAIPWFLKERATFQFRAEAYNVLNRVNLSGFDTDLSSGTFGQATSTYTPRVVQFAARIQF